MKVNDIIEKSATNEASLCHYGRTAINTELSAIQQLLSRIDHQFAAACEAILNCRGRVIVIGMGKSGHIAGKIAATLASTGTPAFFVHPSEANHGDLGMITPEDVLLVISNSGETQEVLTLVPLIKRLDLTLIALTGRPQSSLAKAATINLDISVEKEACPMGLAPTSSTTTTLVMGDALAISLLQARGFTAEDFARFHPGGALGKRLLLRVSDLMHTADAIPKVQKDTPIDRALIEITQKRLGMTTIVDDENRLLGIFTDGDLRRLLDQKRSIENTLIHEAMSTRCVTLSEEALAAKALQLMQSHKITSLAIIDEHQKLIGVLHMHDLLQAGVV